MTPPKRDFHSTRKYKICADALSAASCLSEAFQACRGLFPTEALELFRQIDSKKTDHLLKNIGSNEGQCIQSPERSSFLLSNWDFSRESVQKIAEKTFGLGNHFCLLGTPSLVKHLPASDSQHVLFDANPGFQANESLSVFMFDINQLSGKELENEFDICFLDPPWYADDYIHWITVAINYCKIGGHLAFSLFGELTRPSADEDRVAIFEFCRSMGLEIEIVRDHITYLLPSFEHHMLARSNIPSVSWKKSDLIICKKTSSKTPEGKSVKKHTKLYRRVALKNLTFEVVLDKNQKTPTNLVEKSTDGYWLSTPSRRSKIYIRSNVFTSNGAAFSTPRPLELLRELEKIAKHSEKSQRKLLVDLGFPADICD